MKVLLLLFLPALLAAADQIVPGTLSTDRPTLHHLGLRLPYSNDDNLNATARLRFRASGETVWREGLNLHRVLPNTVVGFAAAQEFAGTIFDLLPGTSYLVELTVTDPDGAFTQTLTQTLSTRPLPPANPILPRIVPVNTVAALEAATNNALPGDVILLAPGVYTVEYLALANSGTAANPIILRGVDRTSTILDGNNCACNAVELFGSYTTIENLTIRNAQQGLRFVTPDTISQTVRGVTFSNIINGINGQPGQVDTLIADSTFTGRIPSNGLTATPTVAPNSYGMQVFGQGVVILHNRISGFEDGIRIFEPGARAIDILNNDITDLADDGMELDLGAGNIRALRNRIVNISSGISTQPIFGGPAYIVRNSVQGVRNEQIKFHSTGGGNPFHPSGVLVYHNTFLSIEKSLSMYSSNPGYNSAFRNNLFVGPAVIADGISAFWTGPRYGVLLDNNGYYPDGQFRFREGTANLNYVSYAAMRAAGVIEAQSTLLTLPLFAAASTFELAAGSNALDRAFALPNLNSSYSGAGPDLGAFERGCAAPSTGPRISTLPFERLTFGSCALGAQLPTVSALAPRAAAGTSQVFSFQFSDSDGAADLGVVNVLINAFLDGRGACYLAFDRPSSVLYLVNDAGTGLAGLALPGTGSVSNGQCTISAAGSLASVSGGTLTLTLAIQFNQTSFGGRKVVYMAARDLSSNNSQWQPMGVYQVGPVPTAVPAVVSITPATGESSSATFTVTYRDVAAGNLRASQLLINQALDGRGACYLGYDIVSNALYLVSDDGGSLLVPAVQPGGPGAASLENSQCRLDNAGTTRAVIGNDLLLTVRLTFKPAFRGLKILYGGVQSVAANSNWHAVGAWTAP